MLEHLADHLKRNQSLIKILTSFITNSRFPGMEKTYGYFAAY